MFSSIVFVILIVVRITCQNEVEEMTPMYLEKQGILLQTKGIASLATYQENLSLMLKLQKPEFPDYTSKCTRICVSRDYHMATTVRECQNPEKTNFEGENAKVSTIDVEQCLVGCTQDNSCLFASHDLVNKCTKFTSPVTLVSTTSRYLSINATCARNIARKYGKCTTDNASKLSKLLSDTLRKERDLIWHEKRTQLEELIEIKDIRKKRQIVAAGAGVILGSLLSLGFNWFNTRNINSKIEDLRSDFQNFAEHEHRFEQSTAKFEDDILKIYRKLESNMENVINNIECNLDTTIMNFLQTRSLDQFRKQLDAILRPLNKGTRIGHLTPEIINIQELKEIILKHRVLNTTIYVQHPSFLYGASKIILADARESDNSIVLHIILTVPVIREKTIHTVYNIEQSGFYSNGSCWKHNLPETVYSVKVPDNGKIKHQFYKLDKQLCKGDIIMYCEQNVDHKTEFSGQNLVQCLSENHIKECEITKETCKDRLVYDKNGILIKSMFKVIGIFRKVIDNKKTYEWDPATSDTRVKWFDWNIYSHVEYKTGVVYATNYDKTIRSVTLANIDQWWDVLRKTNEHLKQTNMTKALQDLQESVDLVNNKDDWFKGSQHQKSKDIVIIISISIVILIGTIIILKTTRNWCIKNCLRKKHPNGQQISMKEIESDVSDDGDDQQSSPYKRSIAVDKRATVRVSWKQPLEDNKNAEEQEEQEQVEEFSLADATSKRGSGISLYFYAKPLND